MVYAFSYKRDLTSDEVGIIEWLLEKERPHWINTVKELKVIGRCGCGKCPTILLGNNFNDAILCNQPVIADYQGFDEMGNFVGVCLMGKDKISELEFYILSDGEVKKLPNLENIKKWKKVQ